MYDVCNRYRKLKSFLSLSDVFRISLEHLYLIHLINMLQRGAENISSTQYLRCTSQSIAGKGKRYDADTR